ncbi:MAG: hypothetical protein M1837_000452 [Sclerophora amabilis]|nr:MAG: hypothetical protein M1837_000452 [Sclerophora amabilis]
MGKTNPLFNLSLFTIAEDMPLFRRPLAGPGYIILNVLQVMNIISLLLIGVASTVMLVKTSIVTEFFFFDAVSHVITLLISLFLVVSELSLFKSYFYRNWPLLSSTSSLITLGIAMIAVGVLTLGNLNKEAASQKSLGLPFWRIVISSGIIVSILGVFNIIANYIFRDRAAGVTARQVRCDGATAGKGSPVSSVKSSKSFRRSLHRSFSSPIFSRSKTETLPSHHTSQNRGGGGGGKGRGGGVGPSIPISISRPMNPNPQFKEYVSPISPMSKPEDAHHPALQPSRHMLFGEKI